MAAENEHVVGDCPEDMESVEEEEITQDAANRLLKFPAVLAALQNQRINEMMASLPASVKRRLKALKKLQFEQTHIEAKFFEEVHALECKYHSLFVPFYTKRQNIITGAYEPEDAECDWVSEDEDEDDLSKQLEEKANITDKPAEPKMDENVKGIPEFWLTIFRNVSLLSEMVQERDEPILKHLIDVKTIFENSPMGFTLEFYFSPNEYFTNTILTKRYDMKSEPDADDPFSFEGPEIFKCKGCTINWNPGKNVTVKTVKKKQKHKSTGVLRTVTKTVQNDSFFNFFSPPTVPDDINADDVDEDLRQLLTTDYEIGHYIRERIVPRAVLYFTGEGIDEDFMDEDEEEEEDEDDGDSDGKEALDKNAKENCKQQ